MKNELHRIDGPMEVTPSSNRAEVESAFQYFRELEQPRRRKSHPDLDARLDKAGGHVLCGRINCGARLAEVFRFSEEDIKRIKEEARESNPDDGINVISHIEFPAGWAPDSRTGGVWRLSTHARGLVRKGFKPRLRRYPGNNGLDSNSVMDSAFDQLPVTAICSTCGFANAVLPEVVSVDLVGLIPSSPR